MMPDLELRYREAGAIRAVLEGETRRLEVLAVPFGGPDRRDRYGQWFDRNSDLMLPVGDRRPALYMHGYSPNKKAMRKPVAIGVAEAARLDDSGLWMTVELDDSELATRTWNAAERGEARASTGSVNYLVRPQPDSRGRYPAGPVEVWPVAELSVFDSGDQRIPVSDDAIVLPMRSYFDQLELEYPEALEAGEDKSAGKPARRSHPETKGKAMNEEIEKAVQDALAAQRKLQADEEARTAAIAAQARRSILAELGLPETHTGPVTQRAIFSIGGKATGKNSRFAFRATPEEREKYDEAALEEADRFLYHLMRPRQAPEAMRVLEESEAAEAAGLIPLPMLDRIVAIRDEASLVAKMGMLRLQTNSLTLRIPREDAAMGVFATIAEEGAYVANEPAFSAEDVTVVKKGSMITITEEVAEDSALFEPYFNALCGRKWGLTENLILFTELKADDTAGTHSATFTQAEIDAFMFQIEEPWADGAHLICAQATMATIRGLLVATPRAYGDFPTFGGLAYPTFFGYPFHMNSNWEAIGAGDTTLTMSLANPAAISWVERRGLSIKVDPYGDALNGRIRYFPSFRAACATTQVKGNVSYTDHA